MILIVGLGNPGRKFQKTRHNVGFRIVDNFQKENKFSNWKLEKKLKAKISEGKIGRKKIILVKPQTFMNESGKSVHLLTKRYTLNPNHLFVVHDDFDLPLGKMKISRSRGSAGHKGVQSIIEEIGTKDFVRLRIGIKPKPYTLNAEPLNDFVLQKFSKKEEKVLKEVKKIACKALVLAIKEGIEKAMTEFNK